MSQRRKSQSKASFRPGHHPHHTDEVLAAIDLSRRPGVGARRFKELVERFGSPSRALAAQPEQIRLPWAAGEGQGRESQGRHGKGRAADGGGPALLEGSDQGATYYGAADYPPLLAEISEPPPYLYWRGPAWPLVGTFVAIVGPRRCSPGGEAFARELAAQLAAAGVGVASGGALGIDSAAHRGALSRNGVTVFVAATGIDRCYPPRNEALHRAIMRKGCVMTELLPGTPPRRDFFPTRNRIIMGLSSALVVVEGRLYSGTYSTACHGMKSGRPLFAWTGCADEKLRALPSLVLDRGGVPVAKANAESILARLSVPMDGTSDPSKGL